MNYKSLFNKTVSILLTAAILFSAWLMLQLTLPYFSFRIDVDFLLTKQSIIHIKIWRWAFYTHISTSLIVLVLGVFQFSKSILRKYPIWHRLAGKIYVILILFASGISGFIMAIYANGGFWAKICFVILSVLWMYFTLQAYMQIRKRNIRQHKNFMIRSYALTLSAITLRLYAMFLPALFHLRGQDAYVLIAWAGWIPNLLFAEYLISRNKTRRKLSPKKT